ncbi:hypothetical protein RND71_038665 [Anisodus tanguticus]|uniref:Pectinesterase inhibitor domain-containing protein n=1 Tax=Anisodus tanguticus TaxID=243964 RepID=A0AAE1UZC8_9SOLA|nr:hypothetical protein RND71_038665 [Anisodus tanguticus]
MGKSTSLIFIRCIIFLSVTLFVTSLDTSLVNKACDLCENEQDFCYNVLGQNLEAQRATNMHDLEGITINLALKNYTAIAKNVLEVTTNETDPNLKQIYRKCLHEYILMRSYFQIIIDTFNSNGNVGQTIFGAASRLSTCMYYFMGNPPLPNPFVMENDNVGSFLGLIRDIANMNN